MDTAADQETQVKEPEPPKASLWEDLIDVFISPAELYRRRAQDGWVKPWIVLSIILIALYYLFYAPNKELALASARELLARKGLTELPAGAQGTTNVMQMIGGIFQPIGVLIGLLLGGAILWVVGLVAQGGPRFRQAMMIVAWASFPTILQKAAQAVLIILKTNSGEALGPVKDTSFGVLRFLDPSSLPTPLVATLSMVDLFAFWQMVLWIVAVKVICNYTAGKATAVGVAAWLVMLLPVIGLGFLGQAFGG